MKYCNERYDGNGYPEGINSNSIPLSTQIASIAIEYNITVKNNGAVAGYVKRIVDYLSSTDLKFSSELNTDWYQGANGEIYNASFRLCDGRVSWEKRSDSNSSPKEISC